MRSSYGEEVLMHKGTVESLVYTLDLWEGQFPQLPYLKKSTLEASKTQCRKLIKQEEMATMMMQWSSRVRLDKISCLIVVGLETGEHIAALQAWLQEDGQRMIIVIEPDFHILKAFLQKAQGRDLILNPQIMLLAPEFGFAIQEPQRELEVLARMCINQNIDLVATPRIESMEGWKDYRAHLLYLCSSFRAIKREALLYPDTLQHVLLNALPCLSNIDIHTFKPQNWPVCAICAAGPSLDQQIQWLKEHQDQLFIVAAGSSVLKLLDENIRVDLIGGVCAFPDHYRRWRRNKCFEIPCMTCTRVQPGVLELMHGPRLHLPGLSASNVVTFVERQMGYEHEADDYGMSVFTASLKALVESGAKEIHVLGLDLSYRDKYKYAQGIESLQAIEDASTLLDLPAEIVDIDGQKKLTTESWLAERQWVDQFLKQHADVNVYQLSQDGLALRFAKTLSLKQAGQKLKGVQRDSGNFLWAQLQMGRDHRHQFEHLSQMFYAACDDLEAVWQLCEKTRIKILQEAEEINSLEECSNWTRQFDQELSEHWSYREFLHYVHWSIRAVQDREVWILKKLPDISEKSAVNSLLTLFAEQVVILKRRCDSIIRKLDSWIVCHLE